MVARTKRASTVSGMTEQLSLFPVPEPPKDTPRKRRGDKRFLSEGRERFELLQTSPTLLKAAQAAARSTVKASDVTSERSASESFEKVLVRQLLTEEVSADINAETIAAAHAAGRTDILGVTFEKGKGIADILVVWKLTGRAPFPVAVNIKKLSPNTKRTEGCSLTQFVALATDPEFDVRNPTPSVQIPTWRAVIEWCAARRKVQPRTDYYLLIGTVEDGKLLDLGFQGMLSTVKGDAATLRKHPNKETVTAIVTDVKPLPDEFDINAALSRAMLPRADMDALRAMLLAVLVENANDDTLVDVAAALLDTDDATLTAWVRQLMPNVTGQ